MTSDGLTMTSCGRGRVLGGPLEVGDEPRPLLRARTVSGDQDVRRG